MKSLLKRTLTGGLFVGAVIASIFLGHIAFSILFFVITLIGLHEFYSNLSKNGINVQTISGIIIGALIFSIVSVVSILNNHFALLFLILPLVFSIFIIELYRKKENPFTNIGYTILGVVYIAIPFSLLNFLSNPLFEDNTYTYSLVLSIFILTWTNDTFAYLTGVTIGKHRLFERHSPKKSWEGFIGGILFSLIAAYLLYRFMPSNLTIIDWLVFAFIISVIGTLGDLVESMFKRSIGIKDSGNLLPGHGGILDRFDGILIAVPFLFCYLIFIKTFFNI